MKTRAYLGNAHSALHLLIRLVFLLGTGHALLRGDDSASLTQPRLLSPIGGDVVRTNMPTLCWDAGGAATCEVWLDGRLEALLGARTGKHIPFPLSYGEHAWHVVVVRDGQRMTSEQARFRVEDAPLSTLPQGAILLRHGWRVESSEVAGKDGSAISSGKIDVEAWSETSLPATALTALVRNGKYPNPYVGKNNMRIPDSDDTFNRKNDLLRHSHLPGKNPWASPYWFTTRFELPSSLSGQRIVLTLGEVNYRAEVWLNGIRVGSALELVGMDQGFRLDVTQAAAVGGTNRLAILVHPVDLPGEPAAPAVTTLAEPGNNMGMDGLICMNYTRWDTQGWDWQQPVRDRAMGITEDVHILGESLIEVADLCVAPQLELGASPVANLVIEATIENHTRRALTTNLRGTVTTPEGTRIPFSAPITLAAEGPTVAVLDATTIPALRLPAPSLWWPAGQGAQPLYQAEVEIDMQGPAVARAARIFGIRKVDTWLRNGRRVFAVNGRELFMQGGNWVNDMMFNWTASRYAAEVRLALASNLNFLRVWGPNGVPPEAFFEEADRRGLLVWQDFLHDHWGTFNNRRGFAPELGLYRRATEAVIRRLRNHPSLFMWCGGNEGVNPREAMIVGELLPALDGRGQRPYLRSSDGDGLMGGGPYHNLLPRAYHGHLKLRGFNSEVGPSGVPEWESLVQFLSMEGDPALPGRFPLSGDWAFHNATDQFGTDPRKFSTYDSLLRTHYGQPEGNGVEAARDYVLRAQLVNHDAYQAAVESLNRGLGNDTTGFALWKFNASWPGLTWQISDWYMRANAGFHCVRRACAPIHIQHNPDDRAILLVNKTNHSFACTVRASLHTGNGAVLWTSERPLQAPSGMASVTGLFPPQHEGLAFLRLEALDAHGVPCSRNFYWLHPKDDFTGLRKLPKAEIIVHAQPVPGTEPCIRVTLLNSGTSPAILLRARILDRETGEELMPVYWSDNYTSLLPGETTILEASLPATTDLARLVVTTDGANAPLTTSTLAHP